MLLPDAGEHGSKKQRWLLASGKTFRTMVATPMMAFDQARLRKLRSCRLKLFRPHWPAMNKGQKGPPPSAWSTTAFWLLDGHCAAGETREV